MNKSIIDKIENNELQFAVFDGQNIETSTGIGVKPIISPMRDNIDYFKNKEVYDTIIGKAAALLLILSGASFVYGKVMSKAAVLVFKQHDIPFMYQNLVDYIENRAKNGVCPLEDAVKDENNPNNAYVKIEQRISELMAKQKG